jgi:hypothetical protein
MNRPSRAQLRRRRRGQSDNLTDPELSEKRRRAAFARWSKIKGKNYTSAQAELGVAAGTPQQTKGGFMRPRSERRQDELLARHVAKRLETGRLASYLHIADNMLPAARVMTMVMNDDKAPAHVRLAAAAGVLDRGGITPKAELPLEERDWSELSLEEIRIMIRRTKEEIAQLDVIEGEVVVDGDYEGGQTEQTRGGAQTNSGDLSGIEKASMSETEAQG